MSFRGPGYSRSHRGRAARPRQISVFSASRISGWLVDGGVLLRADEVEEPGAATSSAAPMTTRADAKLDAPPQEMEQGYPREPRSEATTLAEEEIGTDHQGYQRWPAAVRPGKSPSRSARTEEGARCRRSSSAIARGRRCSRTPASSARRARRRVSRDVSRPTVASVARRNAERSQESPRAPVASHAIAPASQRAAGLSRSTRSGALVRPQPTHRQGTRPRDG